MQLESLIILCCDLLWTAEKNNHSCKITVMSSKVLYFPSLKCRENIKQHQKKITHILQICILNDLLQKTLT